MRRLVWVCLLGVCGAALGQSGGSSTVSAMLQPALGQVGVAVTGLQPERWKLPGQLKQQTTADIGSIQRDLTATLPGLMTEADGAHGSVAADLAVASNVNALYDVLLRVTERAQIAAPEAQASMVGQALQGLEDARKGLSARITVNAAATERQVRDLRASVKTQSDAVTAANAQIATLQAAKMAAPVCPAAKPAVHRTAKKKPASSGTTTAKPATTAAPVGTAGKPSGF